MIMYNWGLIVYERALKQMDKEVDGAIIKGVSRIFNESL